LAQCDPGIIQANGDPMEKLANEDMAALWNGASGQAWVDEQALLDQTYRSIEKLLADAVTASGARSVLDIGCGAGATTLAVARTLAARGNAVGIDISQPLIAVARARAQREGLATAFLCADAQTHDFAPARPPAGWCRPALPASRASPFSPCHRR
jgi:2-polyprenyl-3-methyl-5-hydroxy-6-metoxy-1,4-benzoquinol methylase